MATLRVEKVYLRLTDEVLGYSLDTGEYEYNFCTGIRNMNALAAVISGNQRLHVRFVLNNGKEFSRFTYKPLNPYNSETDWLVYLDHLETVQAYELHMWLHS